MRRIVLFVLALPGVAAADPLRGGGSAPAELQAWVPSFLHPLIGVLVSMQRSLLGDLQSQLAAIRDGGSLSGAVLIIAAAVLYGVVHAAGPGHGKVVIASYLVSRRARMIHAVRISAVIAATQAAVAVSLVAVLYELLDFGSRVLMDRAGQFETLSFALIGLFGLLMIKRGLRGQGCCHGHHEHDHDCAPHCGHDEDHHHAHHRSEALMGALAVGLRPCSGALLVLVFTFANGLAWLGIAAVAGMAVGTAFTTSVVGAGAIGTRSALVRLNDHPILARAIRVAGGVMMAFVGFSMAATTMMMGPTGG